MFSKFGRELVAPAVAYVVRWLQSAGISPNTISYMGFFLTGLSALILAAGYFRWGAIVLLIASIFDMLDGALARATAQSTAFGAFLDSTLDRYSESMTFVALAYYLAVSLLARQVMLILVIIIGSLMVSYTRARAEALNVECKAGYSNVQNESSYSSPDSSSDGYSPILWIMAILTNISAVQRIYEVYINTHQRQLRQHPPSQ